MESVSSKGQEIELAVQNLEDEMMSSQQQLTALEDSLANRYVVLCYCLLFRCALHRFVFLIGQPSF